MPVALHPEATSTPEVVRWVVAEGTPPVLGEIARAPFPLGLLLDDGVVTHVVVEPTAVRVTLAEGRSWREEGPRVRTALTTALADPAGWVPAPDARPEDVLRSVVAEVLASEAGDYVRSHGGTVDLVDVMGTNVTLALGGPCRHCPLRNQTLHGRLEVAIRARFPALGRLELGTVSASSARGRGTGSALAP